MMDCCGYPKPETTPARKLLRIVALGVALCLIWPIAAVAAEPGDTCMVRVKRLNLRSAPSLDSQTVAVLQQGDKGEVIREMAGWLEIDTGQRRGFVRNRSRYVKIIPREQSRPVSKTRKKIDQMRQKAAAVQQAIEQSQSEVVTYSLKEAETISRLDAIDQSLNQTRLRLKHIRSEMDEATATIEAKQRKRGQLLSDIAEQEVYAANRLVALYKLNWLGKAQVLASARSLYELVWRERALKLILAQDEAVIGRMEKNREALAAVEQRLEQQKAEKAMLAKELKQREAEMVEEKERRAALLTQIRSKKSLEMAAIDSLKASAGKLDAVIAALKEALAKETAAARAAAESTRCRHFGRLKGLLPMPVNGKVVTAFGPYRNPKFNVVNFRSGIDIQADRGEPVHAVCAGRVLYADWLKGYGNMLIIDHGDHYYSVYAHVEETFKTKGALVENGEVIATVGDTGSMAGPRLYFELRHHGKPMDPVDWLTTDKRS